MNDGTAFPFVWLAIYLVMQSAGEPVTLMHWFGWKLVYKLIAGVACGYILGKALAYLLFRLPEKYKLVRVNDGFAALAMTLLVYGLTEIINGYGFIAVFVCAVTLRNEEMEQAQVMVVHASPNAPAVDVRINNAVALSGVAFPSNSAYTAVNAGTTNIKVSPAGTTTYVIDANVNLAANTNYSVFAVDSVNKIKAAVVTDNLATPASGKARSSA